MDKQQEIILSILYLLDKVWGRTYLQKFLYLLDREVFDKKLFDFELYKYGPFCEDINDEITDLEKEGLVDEKPLLTKGLETGYVYELTKDGKKTAEDIFNKKLTPEIRASLIQYTNQFRSFTPTQLLKFVYNKYPEVTENSLFEE